MSIDQAAGISPRRGVLGWLSQPLPLHRIAVMRVIAYLFVLLDTLVLTASWIGAKAHAPAGLYQPLAIARLLHLPDPSSASITVLQWLLVGAAVVALTGRWPRLAGSAVFVLYLLWMIIGMSYGKVDHDRFAFLVLLAVLPTVGRARWGDRRRSEPAGFALQIVFVAVMLTYFLSAVAKVRYGGWDWASGATLTRAFVRRGTGLADVILLAPGLVTLAQHVILILEALAPLMLLCRSDRARMLLVAGLLSFHLSVFATVTIIFFPHCIAVLAIFPFERLLRARRC